MGGKVSIKTVHPAKGLSTAVLSLNLAAFSFVQSSY